MSEELFPPKPGGMVDSTRQAAQATPEVRQELTDFDGSAYDPVKVQLRQPEVASSGALVVSTGAGGTAVLRVIGEDGQRYHAVVMTLDQPVVVCFSRTAAEDPRNAGNVAGASAGGFVLPVNVPLPLNGTSEVWVAATSSTATRVSFLRESFAG